jgi:hypothetical protein
MQSPLTAATIGFALARDFLAAVPIGRSALAVAAGSGDRLGIRLAGTQIAVNQNQNYWIDPAGR